MKPNKLVTKALQLQDQGNLAEAGKLFKKVLVSSPTDGVALFSLGRLLLLEGKPEEAFKLANRLLATNKTYAPIFFLRAYVLEKLGRYDEALADLGKGLTIDPNDINELNHQGVLLMRLIRRDEAILSFQRALSLDQNNCMILSNYGKLMFQSRRFEDARILFKRLMDINPDHRYAKGEYTYSKLHEANWNCFDTETATINDEINAGKPSCLPLALMAMSNSAERQLQCARMFSSNSFPRSNKPVSALKQPAHEKIRVAYVSADFRQHPVSHLMIGVIEQHDKSRFETIGLSLGNDDQSALRARFIAAFDTFVDAKLMTSDAISRLIQTMEVDILVDLSGFTADSRTELFASTPAPIQVNFLGYPGTMGADYMDYIVADPHVIPDADRLFYAENVVHLPDTYLPTNSSLVASERTPTREEAGLPASGFVFCSFNHIFKINPGIFDTWMQLLATVANSILWLSRPDDQGAMDNLRKEAERRGIDPQRLIFADRVPLVEDHLVRYGLADLFLDTAPYNAHTTAADALFMGLPVITCSGNTFAGRVAGSLLKAIGLPELVTHSLEEYKQLALALALDPERLAATKTRLRANKTTNPLFNTNGYCRHLEKAFTTMWERHQKGEPPIGFAVEAIR
jgi:predicted O-linked N-acetylglucosamine transferase (SPINDLY family)